MHLEPMLDTYNENSALQATCQKVGNPLLAEMAAAYAADRASQKLVRIIEYGCSGGRNSHAPLHAVLEALWQRSPSLQAECIWEDLPANAWHQAMAEAQKVTAAHESKVHILCAGTSFYGQVCADDSIDLAYSFASTQFPSGYLPLRSHVIMHEAVDAERKEWEAQATRDWERFLLHRSRELKRGGQMLISTMHRDADGYSWQGWSRLLWDCMQRVHAHGSLTKRELDALSVRGCLRSEAEIMAPLKAGAPLASHFKVDALQFARTQIDGERDLPADQFAPLIRRRVQAVVGGMFLGQLEREGRDPNAAKGVMDEVWSLFEEEVARDRGSAWLEVRAYYLQLTRR